MPQSTIQAGASTVTLINVFTVDPADQQRLVERWQQATDDVIRHQPGFISANIHRSLDGTKVVNYAQWEARKPSRRCSETLRQAPCFASWPRSPPQPPSSAKSYRSITPDAQTERDLPARLDPDPSCA
ncbi:MAG: antibiotic biosynthesis monooxygenase [Solirubrobacterales bacterium]|nr:antibiotic biosynthesis monooxygenase [Solirubrobacterales bacterium]